MDDNIKLMVMTIKNPDNKAIVGYMFNRLDSKVVCEQPLKAVQDGEYIINVNTYDLHRTELTSINGYSLTRETVRKILGSMGIPTATYEINIFASQNQDNVFVRLTKLFSLGVILPERWLPVKIDNVIGKEFYESFEQNEGDQ